MHTHTHAHTHTHTHTRAHTHISSSIANLTALVVLYQNKIQLTKHQHPPLCHYYLTISVSNIMEYFDLCRMREAGHTSTKLHFANSRVRKPLSVYVRDAFRTNTWSLSSGLCFQVCNSRHSLFFC